MDKYCPKCFEKSPHDVERCPEDGSYLVSSMDKDLTGEVLNERHTVLGRIGWDAAVATIEVENYHDTCLNCTTN